MARSCVFDCHLSPVGRQMAIENSVSNDCWSTFVDSIKLNSTIVIDCCLSGMIPFRYVISDRSVSLRSLSTDFLEYWRLRGNRVNWHVRQPGNMSIPGAPRGEQGYGYLYNSVSRAFLLLCLPSIRRVEKI